MPTSPFDPSRKPRLPETVTRNLKEKQDYFDPKVAEGGFTVEEAQELGWVVDLYHASKPIPGVGQVEVHSKDSDQGRYGVLQAIYDFELGEHQRAQARAQGLFGRLVREERQQLQALNAAKAAREEAPAGPGLSDEDLVAINMAHKAEQQARREAIKHARQALTLTKELDAFGLLELPDEYLDELNETKPLDAARKERA